MTLLFKAMVIGLLLSIYCLKVAAEDVQSHDSILNTAAAFIDSQIEASLDHETVFTSLDPRLQLPLCDQSLEAFLSNAASIKAGRNIIGVKCSGSKTWSLYVSASLKVYQNVVILTRTLPRGGILTHNDVSMSRMDVANLHFGFFQDINAVINQQTTHNLSQGAILSSRDISPALLVKKGENVGISSASMNLNIQMQGEALMDGALGQRIRIKNLSSGRIISGVVTQAGLVSVNL